jgi:hypothetical protein
LSGVVATVFVLGRVGGHQGDGHGQHGGQGEHQGIALHRFHENLLWVEKTVP